MIDGHHSNQSAQSGEDDAHKSDQVDQSDQPSATEDSAALTSSEDTTAAASQSIPPEDPQEVRGHEISVTTDKFDEEKELCLLPENTQDVGDSVGGGSDLDDLGDGPSDLSREVPTNNEETRLSHSRQEDDTTKGRPFKFCCLTSIKFPQEVMGWCHVVPMQCLGARVNYCW